MLNKNSISYISKSQSCESLNTQLTTETSILSSTRDQEKQTKFSSDKDRRKTILPPSHKPKNEQKAIIDGGDDSANREQITSEKDSQSKPRERKIIRFDIDGNTDNNCIKDAEIATNINSISRQEMMGGIDNMNTQSHIKTIDSTNRNQKNDDNKIENQEETEDEISDGSFDTFILQNFVPYSGRGNVIRWLDTIEETFNQNCIGRNLRFAAISLLVEGEAKRKYIRRRKEIRSYDDFYEFMLSEFDSTDVTSCPSTSCQTVHNQSSALTVTSQMKTAIEPNQSSLNNSNTLNLTGQLPVSSSTTVVANHGVTNSIGVKPVVNTSTVPDSLSTSMLDQTQNDLRKAIVGNLIKNPKTFKGGKDDVTKWIEDIEHLLDLANIPESTRLNLISYSLRGDALEWFKNNRTSLTSWSVFVLELKRAFTSSFHEELAFKKLESYSQGENQSIRTFFNEVLKLCKEADSSMSDATKLKHLLSKTKPSIQFEVRKKKPTSTAEYLEYAKEAEELIQLSSMSTDTTISQITTQVVQQQPISSFTSTQPPSLIQSFQHPSNNYSFSNFRNFDKDYRFMQNRNTHPNRNYSSFSNNNTSQNKSRFNNKSSQSFRQRSSNDSFNTSSRNVQPSRNISSNTKPTRTRTVNAIDLPHPSSDTETLQETLSSIPCSRCSQFGHETSVCPNF